ncbi:uncharacterized protein si:ch73-95l15.5 [Chanos chanos]|uniref:Uncharacterized protein si:ch73-95l15.5 n=1 Tax=Chanos chanos TaxID=29144 RepID=A0A6J2W4S2_CHACN|nr:uncharacterized protein LOC115819785 [Chanos chanos]
MTSRKSSEGCRICGGDLQGNQRRWLFAAQHRRRGRPQTPTGSLSRGVLPSSAHSSPWGSTLSLSSSHSLSKSRTLPTTNKDLDLLSILTHILGQDVPRGGSQMDFICGKCASVLERVFKFDTVIARVRALSTERLQKLTLERDKIRQWVRSSFRRSNPGFGVKGSSSEDDWEAGGERGGSAFEGYREMLRDNMALSEFEWWSEKSNSCPHFKKTGKRCKKGKNCEGCDYLRVSDSDYESVCGVPRHLPDQAFSPLALSRDKSRSMPLHWSRAPSLSGSAISATGSTVSLHGPSRTNSVQSVDLVDGLDPFDWPEEQSFDFDIVLREMKNIGIKPLSSPAGSRIPVLGRRGQNGVDAGVSPRAGVVRVLSYGEEDGRMEVGLDGESEDMLTELRDEFLPLQRQVTRGRGHHAVRQLREQLEQAHSRIRVLEAKLKEETKPVTNGSSQPAYPAEFPRVNTENESELMRNMSRSLHSREKVIQECVTLISKFCSEVGAGTEETDKLVKSLLVNAQPDNKGVVDAQLVELREQEQEMRKELEMLRQAAADRERDLNTLNTVLQCNQDVINELRVELATRERDQKELLKEREAWRDRDQALAAVLRERDTLILHLKEKLQSSQKDVQALSDSVIGQGVSGGGAEAALARQLQEKDALLTAWLKEREEQGTIVKQEVSKLSTALEEAQTTLQDQRQNHAQAISALTDQLRQAQNQLKERAKQKREAEQAWRTEKREREETERTLNDSLLKRNELIEQILSDSEVRDSMLTELQHNIFSKLEPRTALKHTL